MYTLASGRHVGARRRYALPITPSLSYSSVLEANRVRSQSNSPH